MRWAWRKPATSACTSTVRTCPVWPRCCELASNPASEIPLLGVRPSSCMPVVPISARPQHWHVLTWSCHIQNKVHNPYTKQSWCPPTSNRLNLRCAPSIYLPRLNSVNLPTHLSNQFWPPLGSRPSAAWRWPKPAVREFRKRVALSSASQHPFRSAILYSFCCIVLSLDIPHNIYTSGTHKAAAEVSKIENL